MDGRPGDAYEESWARQLRTAVVGGAVLFVLGVAAGWYGMTGVSGSTDRTIWATAATLLLLLGGGAVAAVIVIRRAGLRVDARGVLAIQGKNQVAFDWDECQAVRFVVRLRGGPDGRTVRRKRSESFRIQFAPADAAFQPSERRDLLLEPGQGPYTHSLTVIATGPFADSADRVKAIDEAMSRFGGDTYQGLHHL